MPEPVTPPSSPDPPAETASVGSEESRPRASGLSPGRASILLFLGALVLRLAALNPELPLAPDEKATLAVAFSAGGSGLGFVRPIPTDPSESRLTISLLAWTRPMRALVGAVDSPASLEWMRPASSFATRLLFAVAGALACLVVARAGARLAGPAVGWIAGALLAVAPFGVAESSVIGPAGLAMLLGAAAVLALGELGENGRIGAFVAVGAMSGLAAAITPGGWAFVLAVPFVRPRGTRDALPLGGWVAGATALVAFALGAPGATVAFLAPPAPATWIGATPASSPLAVGLGRLASIAGIVPFLLAIAGGWKLFGRARPGDRAFLLALALSFFLTLLGDGPAPHALALLAPGLALLAAYGALEAIAPGRDGTPSRARRAVVGTALLVSVVLSADAIVARRTPTPLSRTDEWIREHVGAGAPMLLESHDSGIATLDRLEALVARVARGEATREDVDDYAPRGDAWQVLELPAAASRGIEQGIFYDPAYARYFPWIVARDLPGEPAPSETDRARAAFHAWLEEARELAARFPPSREHTGFTVFKKAGETSESDSEPDAADPLLDEESFAAVRDTSTAYTDWLLRGGSMLRSVGELVGAHAFLEPASVREPENAEIRYQLGLVYLLAESFAAAKEQFLLGLFYDPAHGSIHYNLASLLEHEGETEGAETEYRAAIDYLDNPLPARARLAVLLAEAGDPEAARAEHAIIHRLSPGGEEDVFLTDLLGAP